MKNKTAFSILFLLLLLASCSSRENHKEIAGGDMALAQPVAEQSVDSEEMAETPVERKTIKQGEISFETDDVNRTKALISASAEAMGGYIAKDNIYHQTRKIVHRLVIRVPAGKFDKLLAKISESAESLDSKNIEVLDVTEEYIDIETRIKIKKEVENRYKELLSQAKTVEEILKIEKEIGLLRMEIESIEGRMRYLTDQIGFSTLTVEYYQKTVQEFGFSIRFVQALSKGWDLFLLLIIGISHIWPFFLLAGVGLLGYMLFLRIRRK